ncbi:MAG: Na+/H+ antiporter subunit E [Deltaproteobacteria bacterium]|nr:Na+/H+ antiporter subunit E [Deltaproteobacteria bacterium]
MPHRVLHFTATALLLMATWLIWSGHYVFLINTYGVLSVIAVVALGVRLGVVDEEGQPFRLLPRMLLYLPWITWEIVKANWDVAKAIVSPGMPIHQRLVRVKASQKTDLGQVLYANSITITPGTVSLDVRDNTILVHALTQGSYEGLLTGEMDKKVAWLEGEG